MTPLNLKRVQENDTQPKSILCLDNKKVPNVIATIWADETVSINGKDLYLDELRQIECICKNFFLFFNNIEEQKEILIGIVNF